MDFFKSMTDMGITTIPDVTMLEGLDISTEEEMGKLGASLAESGLESLFLDYISRFSDLGRYCSWYLKSLR